MLDPGRVHAGVPERALEPLEVLAGVDAEREMVDADPSLAEAIVPSRPLRGGSRITNVLPACIANNLDSAGAPFHSATNAPDTGISMNENPRTSS